MALGYAYAGKCYPDAQSAMNQMRNDSMLIDGVSMLSPGAWSVTSGGVITWQLYYRPLAAASPALRSGTTQLPICVVQETDTFGLLSVQDSVLGIGLALAFCIGIAAGYMK